MRAWIAMIMSAGILCLGCTHLALERRTIKQGSTLTDLQYQLVLDNVAMFCCNKEALPWHLKLRGGLVQVTDQGQALLSGAAGGTGDLANSISPGGNALRGILGQWDLVPVVDSGDLELLRLAYRKAVYPDDPDLLKEIYKAIGDLSVRFDVLPQQKTIQKILLIVDEEGKQAGVDALRHIIEVLCAEIKPKDTSDEDRIFKSEQIRILCALVPGLCDSVPCCRELRLNKSQTSRLRLQRRPELLSSKNFDEMLNKTSDTSDLILTAIHAAYPAGYLPKNEVKWPSLRNPGLVDQAEDMIRKLEELLEKPEFNTPWFQCGGKKDVPKCACHVGHYCGCGRDCYVWVMPDQLASLREFALAVLTLAPNPSQDLSSLVNMGRGAAFSPSIGR